MHQGQRGYPNQDNVAADIAAGTGYVLDGDAGICGYMMLRGGEEAAYVKLLDGHWLTEGTPYLTIHRIAVTGSQKQKGVARNMLQKATEIARQRGCLSLRVDTHQDNRPMRNFLTKQGFVHCGRIALLDGPEAGNLRVCYEKAL